MKERYYLNKTKYQNHSDEISLVGCESNNYTVGNKINENHIVEWISDSGASCHMIGSKVGLQNYIEFEEKEDSVVADGRKVTMIGSGTFKGYIFDSLNKKVPIKIKDVVFCPNMGVNSPKYYKVLM